MVILGNGENAQVWLLMIFISSWPKCSMKSNILFTSSSGNIHIVGMMYKEGLSLYKNGFAMTFVILICIHEVLGLFILSVRTTAIVQWGRSTFVLLINLASLLSVNKIVESCK